MFGAGDFLGGYASRRVPILAVLVISQGIGLSGMALFALLLGGAPSGADLVAGAVAGVTGGLGVAMLYRGLALSAMALVAPITGVVAAVVPVAFGLASGERPSVLQLVGIACALVAVALFGGGPAAGQRLRPLALLLALGSGVAFGAFYIALAHTSSAAGLWPLVSARGSSVTMFVIAGAVLWRPARIDSRSLSTIAGAGVFDVAANGLYLVAVHSGLLSIVAVLVSLYPAATVACSLLFLRERLRLLQTIGAGVALAAVALVSIG